MKPEPIFEEGAFIITNYSAAILLAMLDRQKGAEDGKLQDAAKDGLVEAVSAGRLPACYYNPEAAAENCKPIISAKEHFTGSVVFWGENANFPSMVEYKDETLYYVPADREPMLVDTPGRPLYSGVSELEEEFRVKFAGLLPEDLDVSAFIGSVRGIINL